MDKRTLDLWKTLSIGLWRSLRRKLTSVTDYQPMTEQEGEAEGWPSYAENNYIKNLEKALAAASEQPADWRSVQPFVAPELAPLNDRTMAKATTLKAARLAMATISGEWANLPEVEKAFIENYVPARMRGAASPLPEARDASPAAPRPGETVFISTLATWKESSKKNRKPGQACSPTAMPLIGVAEDNAPVVMRLRKGDGSGFMDVRRIDGAYARPVLAPEGWKEIDVTEFARCMRGDIPWRDHPLMRRPNPDNDKDILYARVPFGPLPAQTDFAALRAPEDTSERRAAAKAEADASEVGPFYAVGDTVYRRIPEPRLRVGYWQPKVERLEITWQCGDLLEKTIQDTLDPGKDGWDDFVMHGQFEWHVGYEQRREFVEARPRSFSLDSEPVLRAFVGGLEKRLAESGVQRLETQYPRREQVTKEMVDLFEFCLFSRGCRLIDVDRKTADDLQKDLDESCRWGDPRREFLARLLDMGHTKTMTLVRAALEDDAGADNLTAAADALTKSEVVGLQAVGRKHIRSLKTAIAKALGAPAPKIEFGDEEAIAAGFH